MTESPQDPGPDQPSGADDATRSSHRGRRKASSVVLPLVFALALVLVGFLAMWGWITLSGRDDGKPAASPTSPAATSPSPTPSSPSPSATSGSASPSTSGSPSSSPTSSSPSPSPSRTSKTPTAADRSATVVVYNQTAVSGLAAAYAARLQQAGWSVVGVDNWTGTVPETTVYYRPGDEAAARQLMRDVPQVGRIRPAVTGMAPEGLTLILAGNPGTP